MSCSLQSTSIELDLNVFQRRRVFFVLLDRANVQRRRGCGQVTVCPGPGSHGRPGNTPRRLNHGLEGSTLFFPLPWLISIEIKYASIYCEAEFKTPLLEMKDT